MATVRLFQRFETTVGGVTYTGGSITSPKSTAADATSAAEGIFDTHVLCGTTSQKIFDVARDLATGDFDFMWIENVGTQKVAVQATVNAGGNDEFIVRKLDSGETWVMQNDEANTGTTIDKLSSGAGLADTVDEIWAGTSTNTTVLRLFAIT